jgi:hypothetical protein
MHSVQAIAQDWLKLTRAPSAVENTGQHMGLRLLDSNQHEGKSRVNPLGLDFG